MTVTSWNCTKIYEILIYKRKKQYLFAMKITKIWCIMAKQNFELFKSVMKCILMNFDLNQQGSWNDTDFMMLKNKCATRICDLIIEHILKITNTNESI